MKATRLAWEMGRIFGSMRRAYRAGFVTAGNGLSTAASGLEWDGALPNIGAFTSFLNSLVNNSAAALGNFQYNTYAAATGGTIPALSWLGGFLVRSGQVATSDTTDTAANIVSAWPGAKVGDTAPLFVVNLDTGTMTVVAGTNVTLAGTTTVVASAMRIYLLKVTAIATPAVTLQGVASAPATWIA